MGFERRQASSTHRHLETLDSLQHQLSRFDRVTTDGLAMLPVCVRLFYHRSQFFPNPPPCRLVTLVAGWKNLLDTEGDARMYASHCKHECVCPVHTNESKALDRAERNRRRLEEYQLRILGSLAASLFLVTACVRLWPLPDPGANPDITFDMRGQETIAIEEIQQTSQDMRQPPPPAPIPPVVVPDDVILEEIELDLDINMLETENPGENVEVRQGDTTGESTSSVRADSGPKPVRIVQPEYTSEAKRRNVRAEVVVEVLVNERGRVVEVRVLERYLLNKDMTRKEAVSGVGYGVEQAAIAAAERWQFRPAIKNGRSVRAYTVLEFRFGV